MTATVECLGAPFAVRWRVRCSCGHVTRCCERIGVALALHNSHTDLEQLAAMERAA